MTFVNVVFNINGTAVPVDHGYHLLSAIAKHVPTLHGDEKVGIQTISGRLNGDRTLSITENSRLCISVDSDEVSKIIPLAGRTLDINGHRLTVGIPNIHALIPTATLYSRLVVIKGFSEAEPFLTAAGRQLQELGIKGTASLISTKALAERNEGKTGGTKSPWLRRTLKIRDKTIVGFALKVAGLTAEESILLQETGLGGRRRFGCGIFLPARG